MKYINQLGYKKLALIVFSAILVLAIILTRNNTSLDEFSSNIYAVTLGFLTLILLDLGIKIFIYKNKGNELFDANRVLSLVLLALTAILQLNLVRNIFSFPIIFIGGFISFSILLIINVNLDDILILTIIFLLGSAILINDPIILTAGLAPVLITIIDRFELSNFKRDREVKNVSAKKIKVKTKVVKKINKVTKSSKKKQR